MANILGKIGKHIGMALSVMRNEGFPAGCYWLFYEAINQLIPFSVYQVMVLETDRMNPVFLNSTQDYGFSCLKRKQITELSKDPESGMGMLKGFVRDALRNGDKCFGLFAGDKICSYGWYGDKPAHTRRELYFSHNSQFKYERYGFTMSNYRGKRLHEILDGKVCVHYSRNGYKGLICVIERHNLSSLKCHYRVGFMAGGRIYVLMLFGKYYSYSDRRARKYGAMLKSIKKLSAIGRLNMSSLPP